MNFDILTLFPEVFDGVFSKSIIARAIKNKKIKINFHNLKNGLGIIMEQSTTDLMEEVRDC